jgi:hypothetical protein
MTGLEQLREHFNDHVSFRRRRSNLVQIMVPIYHEDGDMVDIYLDESGQRGPRVTDLGKTIMRLSYEYDLDTENKRRIFRQIVTEHGLEEDDGVLSLATEPTELYSAVLQLAYAVAKIGAMRYFGREMIASLFYEQLEEFIDAELSQYGPRKNHVPISDRDDLETDYAFVHAGPVPVFLFAVRDSNKARLAALSFLEYQRAPLLYRGYVVHEDFASLPEKDRTRITSAADKQFTDLSDFKSHAARLFHLDAARA